jgi:hypothetical protein
MARVYEQLSDVIERWARLPEGSYGPKRSLRKMWVAEWGVAVPYYTEGVRSLIELIYAKSLFRGCPRAQNLRHTMFKPDTGGIQTFGDLYDYLRPCDPE